jgi:periplasmic divalent cation tolerance protein
MSQVSVILVTTDSEEQAVTIARTLVEEKLVACVQIVPRIRSIYWWKGEICDSREHLLIMKTVTPLFPAVRERVCRLHGYEVPEIVSFLLSDGLPAYLQWVMDSTTGSLESNR